MEQLDALGRPWPDWVERARYVETVGRGRGAGGMSWHVRLAYPLAEVVVAAIGAGVDSAGGQVRAFGPFLVEVLGLDAAPVLDLLEGASPVVQPKVQALHETAAAGAVERERLLVALRHHVRRAREV